MIPFSFRAHGTITGYRKYKRTETSMCQCHESGDLTMRKHPSFENSRMTKNDCQFVHTQYFVSKQL